MLPARFSSVRHKNRTAVGRPLFRDDSGLVGLRYEKTKAAEPPTLLTAAQNRHSLQPPSAVSLARSNTTATNTTARSAASSVTNFSTSTANTLHSANIVVVPPPQGHFPAIAPPTEQHPALRSPLPAHASAADSWKRDSGHAPTTTSGSTIHEEDEYESDKIAQGDFDAAQSGAHRRYTARPALEREDLVGHLHLEDEAAAFARKLKELQSDAHGIFPTMGACKNDENISDKNPAKRSKALPGFVPADTPAHVGGQASPVDRRGDGAAADAGNPHAASPPSTTPNSPPASHDAGDFDKSPKSATQTSPRKLAKKSSLRQAAGAWTASRSEVAGPDSPVRAQPQMEPQPLGRGLTPTQASPEPAKATTTSRRTTATTVETTASSPPSTSTADTAAADYEPLAISIPTESLLDDDFMTGFSFSKRGSLMFGGKRATKALDGPTEAALPPGPRRHANDKPAAQSDMNGVDRSTSKLNNDEVQGTAVREPLARTATDTTSTTMTSVASSATATARPPPDIRVLSSDVEKESQKVRSLYQTGEPMHWEDGARFSYCEQLEPTLEVPAEEDLHDVYVAIDDGHALCSLAADRWVTRHPNGNGAAAHQFVHPRSARSISHHQDGSRRETELAGGVEDWEDVDGADVDRYGFIAPRSTSRISTPTELKSAQYSPRRRNLLHKRDPMGFSALPGGGRAPSRKVSARSLNTQHSEVSVASFRSSRSVMRQAGNLLPHNRNRRWMDEAGDMLTVSPNLQDEIEEARVEKISQSLKKKEWARSEKWRKMAKVTKQAGEKGEQSDGMQFEFDVNNPKLIERTWKGIPDRWRAAAWWSFMEQAAKGHKESASADDIVTSFHRLQKFSSPDDVQIDLDVPRTISRHIMFRKRYRGGQRLLFRVLHALSIYFPQTGYVQGMASLAATLLCYFDEEKCFVMLVRMWQLRGLDRLYQPGFDGLMMALKEFDTDWLNKDVAAKLSEMSIDSTAYGTRWYLTLFNLSIPFPAQLRVWDVFLLLGDGAHRQAKRQATAATGEGSEVSPKAPTSGLDVLHATSAALIQALSEVLLDSDFENAMKALTAWIPIKDEDLLMKVTKAEWKTRQGKRKA